MYTSRVSRIDRDSVIASALELAGEGGLESVTLRSVAGQLGVTAMAIYRHVESKSALLDGMADRLYAEIELPDPTGDWWEGLAVLAHSTRDVLLKRP